ncbi:MAG TPA: helix-turn-helix domain-containing protein [Actinomycetes bacterium]|nr:helix-turn-helix domain-containing protein [Actinomycetes bacterium]
MTTESPDPSPTSSSGSADSQSSTQSGTPSIGSMVAEAREAADLSIADVSERTRIRKSVIEAIEHDDFSHCGGDFYARGHLRSIGSAVGADPSEWVAEFDRQFGTPAPTATEVFETETSAPVRLRRGVNWSAVMAMALVIAVALVVVQVTSSSDEPTRDRGTVAEPEPTPTEEPSSEPTEESPEVAQAERDQVVVRMTVLPGQRSWISVTRSDESLVWEGTLESEQSKTFRDDKRLSVVAGCASGVELTVNGQNVGSPGSTCGIASASFTPKDPEGAAG